MPDDTAPGDDDDTLPGDDDDTPYVAGPPLGTLERLNVTTNLDPTTGLETWPCGRSSAAWRWA